MPLAINLAAPPVIRLRVKLSPKVSGISIAVCPGLNVNAGFSQAILFGPSLKVGTALLIVDSPVALTDTADKFPPPLVRIKEPDKTPK